MACGADWGGYTGGYDDAYGDGEYESDQWYNGDSQGYQQWDYQDNISKGNINGDILADQVAGYK